jgi:endoglucanase
VKAAGFKTIRIPVSYLKDIGPGPDYTIDSSWLSRVQQVVDYAYSRGMYVITNMHGDGYKSVTGSWLICDSSSQTTIKAKYQKVWQQIASRFQNYDQHLILESMNEEFTGVYGNPTQPCYSNINAYNQIFVDPVRRAGGNNGNGGCSFPAGTRTSTTPRETTASCCRPTGTGPPPFPVVSRG